MCHVLHYSCNVNAAVADSLHCRVMCGTDIVYIRELYTFLIFDLYLDKKIEKLLFAGG